MGCISTVDLQTKMDVQELLSRFCHYLDQNKGSEWAKLFTRSASVDGCPFGVFNGHEEIATIPQYVAEKGAGFLRHHLSNVMFERTANHRELIIKAYCMVTDWSNNGAIVRCFDFEAVLQNKCHWQFAHLIMRSVENRHSMEQANAVSAANTQIAPLHFSTLN